jgi:hypothetical protein
MTVRAVVFAGCALFALFVTVPTRLAAQLRFTEEFEGDLSRWELMGAQAINIRESGDPEHGRVLVLEPHGDVYALIRGSDEWGAVRVAGEVLFPHDDHNYLGVVYNFTRRDDRVDFGNIYIKGNGSYLRMNPHRDGNVGRTLYEEYRTPLTGEAAIHIGEWQRFKLEVVGREAHFYVGDMSRPQVTFALFELTGGLVGFQPRCCGFPVWIDNIRVSSIERFDYRGPSLPEIAYQPESLITRWEVIGPLSKYDDDIARYPGRALSRWRPFATDGRGAVITGAVTDWAGDRTVAYYRTVLEAEQSVTATLHLSTVDDLAVWVNGRFWWFVPRQGLAWFDFWSNPAHEGRRIPLPLVRGENQVVVRVRGGQYATGGFYARVEKP